MRGRKRVLLLALVLSLTLPGCDRWGEEPEPSPEETATATPSPTFWEKPTEQLPFVLPFYPTGGFDPITGANRLNLTLAPLLSEGLFSVGGDFEIHNELCRSYEVSEDGLTWTFTLEQAVFSDGSPLTQREVVDSLERAMKSERYGGRLSDISKVTGGEGTTVVVTLSRPRGSLPALLDVPIVKATEDPLVPLGTGAYHLQPAGEGWKLSARPEAGTPLAEIPLRSVGAGDDLIYAFDAREISLVDTDLTGTNVLGYSGRLETTDYPTSALLYVGFNAQTGVCKEPEVRRALSRAFDREDVTRRLLAGHGVETALPIHPAAPDYDGAWAAKLGYDLEAARTLLEEGGWSRDEEGLLRKRRGEMTLRLVVNQDNTYKITVAEALAESLRGLGCAVTVEKLPWDEFLSALEKKEFDLYLGETLLPADFDPEVLFGSQGELNHGGFEDKETDELLEAFRAAGPQERKGAGAALWAKLAEQAPVAPLCFKNGSLLTQWGQVSGVAPAQRNVFAGLENWQIADS